MSQTDDLRLAAINRHRLRLFGDSSLKVFSMTPADGATEEAEFEADWCGQRVWKTTDKAVTTAEGAWQFKIAAAADWATSQSFMLELATLTVGDQSWIVKKVEKPIGRSLVWKIKAQMQ